MLVHIIVQLVHPKFLSRKRFLIRSDHKYPTASGMASFWDSLQGSTSFESDDQIKFDKTNLIQHKFSDAEPSGKRIKCTKVIKIQ